MEVSEPRVDPSAFLAPGVRIHGNVIIDARAILMFGVVARAEDDRIVVGEESNIQDNSVLHCGADLPCLIGRRVTVGHAAVVHGALVGDHCLVGVGAMALNRSVLGEGAWLAAGAVLGEGRAIPPWTIAAGVPARPVRELTDAERIRADEGVDHYLDLADAYRRLFDG